ncbi:hypothetical protein DID88_006847 [Monilinia fructigena]|uniref:Uncharacterized protein n=1 Tax=Monilinia fructigena TaxID=38457 RepID=A0A395IG68_9HELO|nr:hypothetical protein DID88_006847 [Monilinia fructigena]
MLRSFRVSAKAVELSVGVAESSMDAESPVRHRLHQSEVAASARALAVVPIPLIVGSAERSSSMHPRSRSVSQLVSRLIAFDAHMTWGPSNADFELVYDGHGIQGRPTGKYGRVSPHTPDHRSAVDAHPYMLIQGPKDFQRALQTFEGSNRFGVKDVGDAVYRSASCSN